MVAVLATPIATQQIAKLRGRAKSAFESWLARAKKSGCAALTYRLTGHSVDRLCVYHLVGELRVIVAFQARERAVVLLVGPHVDSDPGIDVYAQLYDLLQISIPQGRRDKPPCCGADGRPPLWGDDVEMLTDRFRKLTRRR